MTDSKFGEKFVGVVRDYLSRNNLKSLGRINAPILAELAQRFYEKHTRDTKIASKNASDTEWLNELKNDEAYRGINVYIEHSKCVRWCKENNAKPTRKRFINWLNRIDRPLVDTAATNTKLHLDPYQEPAFDWRRAIATKWPREDYPNREPWEEMKWGEIDLYYRKQLLGLKE